MTPIENSAAYAASHSVSQMVYIRHEILQLIADQLPPSLEFQPQYLPLPPKEVCNLTVWQCYYLMKGPKITLYLGDIQVRRNVPFRAFAALFGNTTGLLGYEPYDFNGTVPEEIHLPIGPVDDNFLRLILKKIEQPLSKFEIPYYRKFKDCVQMYEAARCLGALDYAHDLKRWMRRFINEDLLTAEDIGIFKDTIPPGDVMFYYMVHRLAHRIDEGKMSEALRVPVEDCPALKISVQNFRNRIRESEAREKARKEAEDAQKEAEVVAPVAPQQLLTQTTDGFARLFENLTICFPQSRR